jgi:hypothetical protein
MPDFFVFKDRRNLAPIASWSKSAMIPVTPNREIISLHQLQLRSRLWSRQDERNPESGFTKAA